MTSQAAGAGFLGERPPTDPGHAYWRGAVAPYERPSTLSALFGVATSAVAYILLTVAMYLRSTSPSG